MTGLCSSLECSVWFVTILNNLKINSFFIIEIIFAIKQLQTMQGLYLLKKEIQKKCILPFSKKNFLLFIECYRSLLNPKKSPCILNYLVFIIGPSFVKKILLFNNPYIHNKPAHCLVGRVFANGRGDLGSIPGHVIPKTLKTVLDTYMLNTQQYKVCIKGKVDQFWERSSALP